MSGGKGGSTSSTVTVPQYIEDAARANLAKANEISKIGYTPYYGPDVAAFTPMQRAAFQNTADMAGAFGMAGAPIDTYSATGQRMGNIGRSTAGSAFPIGMSQQDIMGGMPTPTTYAGGVQGYSSAPMFEQSMAELEVRRPGQYAAINAPFIDFVTGAQPMAPYGTGGADEAAAAGAAYANVNTGPRYGAGGSDNTGAMTVDEQNASFGLSPSGTISAALPGGVNDRNLGRPVNQFIAGATSPAQQTGAPTSSVRPVGRDSAGTSDTGSCVVATHAVNSGAFTPAMKREAVVWCMKALHGKWWGEAVRRGYRHCGNKKIEQGKAREHYGEFRRYVDFASGKKRTLRGAFTFTFRTAQFFAIGLVKRGA